MIKLTKSKEHQHEKYIDAPFLPTEHHTPYGKNNE
jgi:hypothetical protein